MSSAWKSTQQTVSALKASVYHCDFYAERGTQIPELAAWVPFQYMRGPSEETAAVLGPAPPGPTHRGLFRGPHGSVLKEEGVRGEGSEAQAGKIGENSPHSLF